MPGKSGSSNGKGLMLGVGNNSGRGNGADNGHGHGDNPSHGHGNGNGHGKGLALGPPHLSSSWIGSELVDITGVEAFADAEQFTFTTFKALNGSGVSGAAVVAFDEDTNEVTVHIRAYGLEPDMVHPQHIHGFLDGTEAKVPTPRVDRVLGDSDGYIELLEGLETYGPILLTLTEDADAADDPGTLNFPTAPDGTINFTQTYDLDDLAVDLPADDPMLALREIVLHGMTLDEGDGANGGEADGTAGYKAVLPVAAGALEEINSKGDLMKLSNAGDFDSDHNGPPAHVMFSDMPPVGLQVNDMAFG